MIELNHVTKRFNDVEVIQDLSLTISMGKTVVLIGPSGCGKSTLLRLMVGLVWPDRGHISLFQQPLKPENVEDIRQKVGFVLQDGGLFPHLTAGDNIRLMATYLNYEPHRIEQRLSELCDLTHISATLLSHYPHELSGGQVQRIALMRALMLDPEILFLDEPLGALDPLSRVSLQDEMRNIFRQLNKTVVLVTHDMGEAAALADLIVIMKAGQLLQYDTLATLSSDPADPFVSKFINAQRKPWQRLEDQIK